MAATSTFEFTRGPARSGDTAPASHAIAIARTLASVLDDALARADLRTAADVAAQLAEEIHRLRR